MPTIEVRQEHLVRARAACANLPDAQRRALFKVRVIKEATFPILGRVGYDVSEHDNARLAAFLDDVAKMPDDAELGGSFTFWAEPRSAAEATAEKVQRLENSASKLFAGLLVKCAEIGREEASAPLLAELEAAWGIIANVSEGDWQKQPSGWVEAAVKWRDRCLPLIQAQQQKRLADQERRANAYAAHRMAEDAGRCPHVRAVDQLRCRLAPGHQGHCRFVGDPENETLRRDDPEYLARLEKLGKMHETEVPAPPCPKCGQHTPMTKRGCIFCGAALPPIGPQGFWPEPGRPIFDPAIHGAQGTQGPVGAPGPQGATFHGDGPGPQGAQAVDPSELLARPSDDTGGAGDFPGGHPVPQIQRGTRGPEEVD